jgi:hypothetical protein
LVSLPPLLRAEEKVNSVLTALSATTISGYVNTSAHWVPGSKGTTAAYAYGGYNSEVLADPGSGFSGASPSSSKDDGFNLNVVDLTISHPISPEENWSAGYKAELWFGPDANLLFNNSLGINVSDFNIKQAYVELGVPVGNTLDLKLGVWDTIIGYEVGNAPDNPNFTRSWGYTIEPTQHTGLLGTYKFCEFFSVAGGIANTWDSRINGRVPDGEAMKTYLGSITLTAPESMGFLKGATLTAGVVDGRTSGNGSPPDRTSLYVGASVPTPVQNLAVGAAWDHLNLDDRSGVSTHDTDVYGAYILFKATEKLTLNLRGEYVHWGDLAGLSSSPSGVPGSVVDPFEPGDEVLSVTATLDYSLWKNVISRFEYRWDHDLKADRHFGQGTRDNDHLLALNVIYRF